MPRPVNPQSDSSTNEQAVAVAPPTPTELFEQLWHKLGFVDDPQVLKDFQQLSLQAESNDSSEQPPKSSPKLAGPHFTLAVDKL
jgi:exonuclease SbcD